MAARWLLLALLGCGADTVGRSVDTGPPAPLTGERAPYVPRPQVAWTMAPPAEITAIEATDHPTGEARADPTARWADGEGARVALVPGPGDADFVVRASLVARGRVWRWEVARLSTDRPVLVRVPLPEGVAVDDAAQLQVVVRASRDGRDREWVLAPRPARGEG